MVPQIPPGRQRQCFLFPLPAMIFTKTVVGYADVSASSTDTQIVSVTDTNSSLAGTSLEIEAGALNADTTVTISQVSNPPNLPADMVSTSVVVDFGPDGLQFNTPVKILIPYSQTLLDQAGLTDPNNLTVWTYNTSGSTWERIAVDSVDAANNMLIFYTDHFSLYTAAATVSSDPAPPDPDPGTTDDSGDSNSGSDGGGGGGGGCFLNSLGWTSFKFF